MTFLFPPSSSSPGTGGSGGNDNGGAARRRMSWAGLPQVQDMHVAAVTSFGDGESYEHRYANQEI